MKREERARERTRESEREREREGASKRERVRASERERLGAGGGAAHVVWFTFARIGVGRVGRRVGPLRG